MATADGGRWPTAPDRGAPHIRTPRRLGLLVVDLDGTLLGPDRAIGAADAEALRRAAAAGVTLCVATGRGLHTARPVLATLPVPAYAALHNGALMLDPDGAELWRTPLHPAAVAAAVALVRAAGLHPLLYARPLAAAPQAVAGPESPPHAEASQQVAGAAQPARGGQAAGGTMPTGGPAPGAVRQPAAAGAMPAGGPPGGPAPGAAWQLGGAGRTAVPTTAPRAPQPPPVAGALLAGARQPADARLAAGATAARAAPPDLALVLERAARRAADTQAYLSSKDAILEVTGDLLGARHRGVLGLVAFGPRAAVTAAAEALKPLHGRLVSWWSTPLHDSAYLLEVAAPQGTKRGAAERLTCRLGLTRDRVAAIGDNNNDLELLNYAGVGIAMANATPGLRAAAAFVTTSNTEAGVARALEWLDAEPFR